MDFHLRTMFDLLIIASILCLARATDSGSVYFLDSVSRPYLRAQSSNDVDDSMSLPEVGAAVSVLLGFAPSAALSATGSSKLNKVLLPDPFNRPRAAFMLEVRGVEDAHLKAYKDNAFLTGALTKKVTIGSDKADIQFSDEDAISVISLNEPLSFVSDEDINEEFISDFASKFGGSYVTDTSKLVNGELTIPLASGTSLRLEMTKKADLEFTTSLVSLLHNVRRITETHEVLSESIRSRAELLTGFFDGFKYGPEGLDQQRVELFFSVLSKIFESLQTSYEGHIVGVILASPTPPPVSDRNLNVVFNLRQSPRLLAENKSSLDITIAKIILVRSTLAWLTGIILLVATILGVYFLLNMPITRDTLLYSNVKLD